jgi:hypothetical protein
MAAERGIVRAVGKCVGTICQSLQAGFRPSCVWPVPIHGSEAISDAFKKLLEGKDRRTLLTDPLEIYLPIFEANRGINATAEQ